MRSSLITVKAYYSLENKERYNNFVLIGEEKYIFTLFYDKSVVTCYYHVILFSTCLYFPRRVIKLLFHRLQRQNLFMAFKRVPR